MFQGRGEKPTCRKPNFFWRMLWMDVLKIRGTNTQSRWFFCGFGWIMVAFWETFVFAFWYGNHTELYSFNVEYRIHT